MASQKSPQTKEPPMEHMTYLAYQTSGSKRFQAKWHRTHRLLPMCPLALCNLCCASLQVCSSGCYTIITTSSFLLPRLMTLFGPLLVLMGSSLCFRTRIVHVLSCRYACLLAAPCCCFAPATHNFVRWQLLVLERKKVGAHFFSDWEGVLPLAVMEAFWAWLWLGSEEHPGPYESQRTPPEDTAANAPAIADMPEIPAVTELPGILGTTWGDLFDAQQRELTVWGFTQRVWDSRNWKFVDACFSDVKQTATSYGFTVPESIDDVWCAESEVNTGVPCCPHAMPLPPCHAIACRPHAMPCHAR